MRSSLSRVAIITIAILGLVTVASADIPNLQMAMQVGTDTPTMWNPTGSDNGDGTYDFDGLRSEAMWDVTWNLTVDDEPWINAVIGVTNNTASTQTYAVVVTLPTSLASPTQHAGSMQGGLTDNTYNSSNATVATDSVSGDPLYYGLIDGAGVLSIYPDPDSWSAPFDGGSASIPAMNVGFDGFGNPTLPSGAVTTSIGIQHRFTLTAGDSATFSSYFKVVPEPTTATLLLLGSAALIRRRRAL